MSTITGTSTVIGPDPVITSASTTVPSPNITIAYPQYPTPPQTWIPLPDTSGSSYGSTYSVPSPTVVIGSDVPKKLEREDVLIIHHPKGSVLDAYQVLQVVQSVKNVYPEWGEKYIVLPHGCRVKGKDVNELLARELKVGKDGPVP